MNIFKTALRVACAALLVACALTSSAAAQDIELDKPVMAGELILFPSVSDANAYYYVPDKPKLAVGPDSRPQFSFLRYVENVRSAADQPEAREGEGGGIVHALVSLSVTREQITAAQNALQAVRPEARIQGPVVFKAGRFTLVSSFKEENGRLTTKVVGMGTAPLLDGEKAAVSMQLTKLGAKVLWESFKTPTPDISFSFEMDMTGYRSPKRALIEANFDQIYEHHAFSAGVASSFLAGEVKLAFDDLVRSGAIKLTQVGTDERLDALITTAYNKIADLMFNPLNGTGTPSLESLTSAAGGSGGSMLDRASALYTRNREDADRRNEESRRLDREEADRRRTDEERRRTDEERRAASTQGTTSPTPTPASGGAAATGDVDRQVSERREPASGAGPHVPAAARQQGVGAPPQSASSSSGSAPSASPTPRPQVSAAPFTVAAAYEFKRVRQRGVFKVDLNKYTADTITLRFDENIGDLRRYFGEAGHFREVNLDDALYRQREIVAFLDSLNSQDFGQYVNFVSVRLHKRHAGGDETHDEVRIDRNNFNQQGNNFKLLYGWKGDADRRRWMEYEYQATWSFVGGRSVEQPWQTTTSGAITLAPPYLRRTVELQADPAALAVAEVRAVTVRLFYSLGGPEQVRQVTLNATGGQLSQRIEFMLPADRADYAYDVTWRLRGDRTVSSGRRTTSDSILFVDEVPRT